MTVEQAWRSGRLLRRRALISPPTGCRPDHYGPGVTIRCIAETSAHACDEDAARRQRGSRQDVLCGAYGSPVGPLVATESAIGVDSVPLSRWCRPRSVIAAAGGSGRQRPHPGSRGPAAVHRGAPQHPGRRPGAGTLAGRPLRSSRPARARLRRAARQSRAPPRRHRNPDSARPAAASKPASISVSEAPCTHSAGHRLTLMSTRPNSLSACLRAAWRGQLR